VEPQRDRFAGWRTGSRLARSDSAQGKVFLAFGGDGSELNARELQRILDSAIAVNTQTRDGIRAVATPVFQDREAIAAMAVVGTIANLPERETSKLAVRLRESAEQLSAELGFSVDHERSTA